MHIWIFTDGYYSFEMPQYIKQVYVYAYNIYTYIHVLSESSHLLDVLWHLRLGILVTAIQS